MEKHVYVDMFTPMCSHLQYIEFKVLLCILNKHFYLYVFMNCLSRGGIRKNVFFIGVQSSEIYVSGDMNQ